MYKKLLFIIPLLIGCAREYECDVGTLDVDGEFHSIGGAGIPGDDSAEISILSTVTVDWPDGRKEAEEVCAASFNSVNRHCICERTN